MDDKELLSLVQCHVDSILFKSCADTELVATIQEVAAGKSIFDRTLLQRARDLAGERHVSTASANLSPREREILELIRQGMTNDEIAERLGIKVGSTKIHVHNILAKTGAKSRRELN
jgi:DNA-binding NarL/FixJ family response regulator